MRIHVYGKPRNVEAGFDDYLDPAKTAVVSIDMHRGHLDPSPDCPCPAPRARDIVAPIDAFHDQVRALGIPIIHVRSVLRRGGVDDVNGIPSAWRRTFPLYVGEIPNSDAHAIEGSPWTEFVTRVEPQDLIVETKRRLSAFYPTDLDFLLRNMRVEAVVLDGGFTDCCVLNTAFDASNHNYRVLVAQDLVRGTDDSLEAAALAMVSLHLGLVVEFLRPSGRMAKAKAQHMKPPLFAYQAPRTIADAVAALCSHADAMVLAGGQSLLPAMNFRVAHPSLLVDIQHVAGLKGISIEGDEIVVKAMVRHRELELDEAVGRANPLIAEILRHVAHIPIRNRGTIVGSLCHADPSAELPMLLVLLGGTVVAQGSAGKRRIAADQFFHSFLTTTRRSDEIVIEARFPVLARTAGWAFDEVTRRHGDFAIAGVGAIVRLDAQGRASEVRLAACGVAERPLRLTEAEHHLVGTDLTPADLNAAGKLAASAVTVPGDMHASTSYRRRVVGTLTARTVATAAERARRRTAS